MPQTVPAGWAQEGDALTRTIARADFVEALALAVEIGKLAEAANHHPDINIHRYRHVRLTLSTHSAGSTVTEKDFTLAQQINDLSDATIRQTTDDLRSRFKA
jgi:4a-hydroxytetrahydrobiopterin dehydratase